MAETDQIAVARLMRQLSTNKSTIATIMPAISASSTFTNSQGELVAEYKDALVDACKRDDAEIIQWILEGAGIPVDYVFRNSGAILLHRATAMSKPAVTTSYLLAKGAEIDKRSTIGYTALGKCLGDYRVYQRILACDADATCRGR